MFGFSRKGDGAWKVAIDQDGAITLTTFVEGDEVASLTMQPIGARLLAQQLIAMAQAADPPTQPNSDPKKVTP